MRGSRVRRVWVLCLGTLGVAGAAGAEEVPPESVTVVGTKDAGYAAGEASAGKVEGPVFEEPQFISVVPETVIEDQAVDDLRGALRNVSGVAAENIGGFAGPADSQFLRGFRSRALYYNGFLVEAIPSVNPALIARLEYLKGPASVLYGPIEPGGVINLVTHQPTATPNYRLRTRYGSWRFSQTTVDVGGPIDADGDLRYRVNAGYRHNASFRDDVEDDRRWLVPAMTWTPTKGTRLHVELSLNSQQRVIDEGVSFDNERKPVADISTFLGERGLPGQRFEHQMLMVRLEQDLGDHLTFRSGFLGSLWANDMRGVRRSRPLATDMGTVQRLFEDSEFEQQSTHWQNDLLARFSLGPTRHEVIAGVDWRMRTTDLEVRRGAAPEASITDPIQGNPDPTEFNVTPLVQKLSWLSFYGVERLTLFDDLHVNVGARYDTVNQTDENNGMEPSKEDQDDDALTAQAGVLYVLPRFAGQAVAVFGDFSQSFFPTASGQQDKDGNALDPETGEQLEAGLKLDLLGGAVSGTLAWFQVTKENVAIPDPDNDGAVRNAGRLRSQGLEVELAGQPVAGLEIIASYGLTDTEVLESTSLPEGNRFRNVPAHAFSFWGKYTLQTTPLKGLGVGAGIFGVSARAGDDADEFELPAYTRVDAALYYTRALAAGPTMRLQLNAENLGDTEYYESSLAATRVFPGSPRAVDVSLGVDF
ncbi:MAG: TonB-dependent siderophore receptor [Myxococcales bacterium]|nr:TonB-dependent siderophore receptor [Myxococcales bacterium]